MPRGPIYLLFACCLLCFASGCTMIAPEVSTQPVLHNPFPQLSRVAVAPFFNQSDEPTVDGREFAMAYYAELQGLPGFEVAPVGVVEAAMLQYNITPDSPEAARKLAQLIGVDVLVVGSVTDFNMYYPPRCGMRVDWYAANPGFHEIPAGYGLPWGTPEEEYIPERLVFEAEMALARAQMETQSPACGMSAASEMHSPRLMAPPAAAAPMAPGDGEGANEPAPEELPAPVDGDAEQVAYDAPLDASLDGPHEFDSGAGAGAIAMDGATAMSSATGAVALGGPMPPGWPDARGFTPPGPTCVRPECLPHGGPVITHTRIFRGNDPDFTSALASYVEFRDDARFGGWQSYLERSDDFIRFCAHLHLAEMLTARGGGSETRVTRRWSNRR